MRAPAATALALLLAACAAPQPLQVIDNVLRHEGPPPPSPAMVRALLAQPLAAQDAAAIFEGSAPAALGRLAAPVSADTGLPLDLRRLLDPYVAELAAAQRALRAALPLPPALPASLPTPDLQREVAARIDESALQRAASLFLEANARFAQAVRAAASRVVFPERGARIEFDAGVIVIGTAGDDTHVLSPLRAARVSVIVDPGGNDRYLGSDPVLHGLAAIIDLGGNDHYASDGPAWGAAVAGVSLLLDVSGDDVYEAGEFGLGAALAGVGALVDLEGNDVYRLRAFGQGLGLALGTGLLWDRTGNDRYLAAGPPDPFGRGGGLSFAQGIAVGVRTGRGGGVGILRDDAGSDTYEAQMFAQGTGYYYALGLLWDRSGDDRYRAVRYAQGNGVHEAIGVLRDEAGNDDYGLSVGVGQGMGLDLAVGVLADLEGDDRYAAPNLAQGAASANGVGIIIDAAGRNAWRLEQKDGWGRAEWSRGLPSVGLVLADAPVNTGPATHEAGGAASCAPAPAAPPAQVSAAQALRALGPGFVSGKPEGSAYALLLEALRTRTRTTLAELPADDFDVLWPLGIALRCALEGASAAQAAGMWDAFEGMLRASPDTRYAGPLAGALRARPAPAVQMRRLIDRLAVHPSCAVRTAALALDGSAGAAQAALRSGCWQLQARALRILEQEGAAPRAPGAAPPFLRNAPKRAVRRAP
jgi:hypothetical protein